MKMKKKDRVGAAGEPEMPTKTYVCLKHGVQFEPLEKVVFNERLFFLLRFLPSTKSFLRCVHKWTESQKVVSIVFGQAVGVEHVSLHSSLASYFCRFL